jgi:hypothetical protein
MPERQRECFKGDRSTKVLDTFPFRDQHLELGVQSAPAMAQSTISSNLAMSDLEKRLNRATPDINNPCWKFWVHNLLTRRMICLTIINPCGEHMDIS